MALYEQTKSINAIKLHKNFSNFSLHLIKSIALSSLLQELAGIITEVIKFYQAHIFPNWIQHLLYGEEWFLSQSFHIKQKFNNDNINSSRGNETDHKM